MATQKRLSPKTKAKQWVITAQDAIPPNFEHRIKLEGNAYLVLSYKYDPTRGYVTWGNVELDGVQFDNEKYFADTFYDGWHDYINVHFKLGFMANRYTFDLPGNVRKLIEKRLELLIEATPPFDVDEPTAEVEQ